MITLVQLNNILMIYDNGNVWNDIGDISTLIILIIISIFLMPLTIIGDIVCMPIEIFIFLMRKRNEAQFNKEYTINDFISEIMN